MPLPHPALGRHCRMYPKDWGAQFVQLVAEGTELMVPDAGFYTATIVKIDGRGRAAVQLELREFTPIESEHRSLDFVRGRLILAADEDEWELLPGKGAPKRKRVPTTAPVAQHVEGMQ